MGRSYVGPPLGSSNAATKQRGSPHPDTDGAREGDPMRTRRKTTIDTTGTAVTTTEAAAPTITGAAMQRAGTPPKNVMPPVAVTTSPAADPAFKAYFGLPLAGANPDMPTAQMNELLPPAERLTPAQLNQVTMSGYYTYADFLMSNEWKFRSQFMGDETLAKFFLRVFPPNFLEPYTTQVGGKWNMSFNGLNWHSGSGWAGRIELVYGSPDADGNRNFIQGMD